MAYEARYGNKCVDEIIIDKNGNVMAYYDQIIPLKFINGKAEKLKELIELHKERQRLAAQLKNVRMETELSQKLKKQIDKLYEDYEKLKSQ